MKEIKNVFVLNVYINVLDFPMFAKRNVLGIAYSLPLQHPAL